MVGASEERRIRSEAKEIQQAVKELTGRRIFIAGDCDAKMIEAMRLLEQAAETPAQASVFIYLCGRA